MSYIKPSIITRPFTGATYTRGERYYVDSIGPLPEDEFGHKYILTCIDAFTWYVELVPTRSTDAEHAVIALNQIFGRIGVPRELVSNRGTQYANTLVKEYCALAGVRKTLTTAHSKEENVLSNERTKK